MAELNPPLGTTTPEIFLDNVKRADELVNGPAGTVNDRAGEPLDTWRQMMAKNDEVRQNLIPLSKQYAALAAAQADIANIPVGSTTYYRSPDDSALAIEVINTAGTLTATGRKIPAYSSLRRGNILFDAFNEYSSSLLTFANWDWYKGA
ncbi:right-handed parallel beta-helix repeat-containing protein, partial [Klebsiella pneumoniae]|nr:right-handed parallel beta-helix repeat-containing protein [Klebsiella pneumoniae]